MGQAASEGLRPRPLLIPQLAIGSDWSTSLPDYSPREPTDPFGRALYPSIRHTNSDFYRERAEDVRFGAKLRPIRFSVRNEGTALASDVKLIAHIADPTHPLEFSLGSDRPKNPRREWSPIDNIRPISLNHVAPDIEVTETSAGWTISAYLGKIQAKDTRLTSEQLFVGMTQSGTTKLPVSVFADELSSPVSSTLSIDFVVTEQELTYDKLTS
jgi:hypothetical protein